MQGAADVPNEVVTTASNEKPTAPPLQFDTSMTVAQLKDLCRARGLKVSGIKAELIERLRIGADGGGGGGGDATSSPTIGRTVKRTATTVKKMLEAAGLTSYSRCAASAIARGHLRWSGAKEELDQQALMGNGSPLEVTPSRSECCGHILKPTLRDLLKQPDYAGLDYEDGLYNATVKCREDDCGGRIYLTRMCEGAFEPDSGKFHNHCTRCPGLGKCIGDYREEHCDNCGKHYFAGLSGFPCSCQEGGEYDDDFDDFNEY